eukprot:TCONS_00059520-protein
METFYCVFLFMLYLLSYLHRTISVPGRTGLDEEFHCHPNGMTFVIYNFTLYERNNITIKFKNVTGKSAGDCTRKYTQEVKVPPALRAPYNECGIESHQRNGELVYTQTIIVSYNETISVERLVYREHIFDIHLECTISKLHEVELDGYLNVTKSKERVFTKVGDVTIDLQMIRFTDATFTKEDISPILKLDKFMYFLITMSPDNGFFLSLQQCYATNEWNSTERHYIIEDKCPNIDDNTVQIMESEHPTAVIKWQSKAFRFFESNSLFIKCEVFICDPGSPFPHPECMPCDLSLVDKKRRGLRSPSTDELKKSTVTSKMYYLIGEEEDHYAPENQKQPAIFSGTKGTIILVLLILFILAVLICFIKKFIEFVAKYNERHAKDVNLEENTQNVNEEKL